MAKDTPHRTGWFWTIALASCLSITTEVQSTSIVIDEILADPPTGTAGDANRDGVRQTYADEFIELVNTGTDTIAIAGWQLGDDDTASRFTFPDSTQLPPGGRLVLFGGGTPTGFAVPTFADDGRIGNGLTNAGDVVLLLDARGDTVDRVDFSPWPQDQSIVRSGSSFAAHKEVSTTGERFSPGRVLDAAVGASPPAADSTATSSPADTTTATPSPTTTPSVEGISPVPRPRPHYPITISEILADPPSGPAGDANGDGRRHTYEDEFIELHNTGTAAISLAGWQLGDDDTATRFTFPADARIAPDGYAVLFGGGTPIDPAAFAADGRIGNGLTNSGDRLLLLDAAADTVLDITFASKSNINQSLVRIDGQFELHNLLPGKGRFSPGRSRTQYTAFTIADPQLIAGDTRDLLLLAHYPTGTDTLADADFQWLSVEPTIAQIRPGASVRALRPGRTRLECWRNAHFFAQRIIRVRALDPPNDPPLITSQPDTTAFADGWYRYAIRASDPEANSLVYTFAQAPPWLRLDSQTGLIQGRTPDTIGIFTIVFEAADGRGGLAAQRYRLHVLPRPQVRIAEILSDPPQGLSGDANGDGRRHAFEDEFVELHNAGPAPIDLGGCRLADDKRPIFSFPASTILSPDARAVVFGGGRAFPNGDLRFTAGGRLGDGLGNRRDALYLIGPASHDTLARLVYDLRRDPDQSILGDGHTLHATWPGRTPFSPGAPRPVLQSLRPNHHTLHLVRGEQRQLRLIGSYSDGGEYPVAAAAHWTSSDAAIASVAKDGALTAVDTGTCHIAVHLDSFAVHPDTVSLHIRPPLVETLRFSPAWQAASITGDQPFIVRTSHPAKQSYTWFRNGQRLPVMAPQYLHTPMGLDTIRVQIRRSFETVSRQWIVQSPAAKRAVRSFLAAPNPFNAATRIYFHLARAGHVRLDLYNMQGQRVRILANAEFNVGSHQLNWDGRDRQGRPVATGLYLAWLVTSHTQSHAKLLLLR